MVLVVSITVDGKGPLNRGHVSDRTGRIMNIKCIEPEDTMSTSSLSEAR